MWYHQWMESSVMVLVGLALCGAALAAWAASIQPKLGRPAKVGRWMALVVPAVTVIAFVAGLLLAEHATSSASPENGRRCWGTA
jgi:hypothetical protein